MTGRPAPLPATPQMPDVQEQPSSRSKIKDAVIEIATTVGLAIILYLVITTFIVQTFRVEQTSMQNTLQSGEHLLIDKLTPRFDDYSRGDIIVFHPNGATDETPYIKRVIGVGGDNVQIANGLVYVNGVELDETDYTFEFPGQNEPTVAKNGGNTFDVPEGQLFVLGDHRQRSTDSRNVSVGLVDVDDVVGRAWLRFWPLDTLGIVSVPAYPELEGV